VITAVVVKDHGAPATYGVANAPQDRSFAAVRFTPQATASEISNFLGAYKATVVEGPMKGIGGSHYRIRLSDTKLTSEEVGKIIRDMQGETKIVAFIAEAPPPSQ
jgi:hypothetical protein